MSGQGPGSSGHVASDGASGQQNGQQNGQPRAERGMVVCLLLLAALIPLGVHFGGSLIARRSFAFRDAAHYYYPLYEWISREWSAGRVPLWNPQENGGFPVLADATSSVFYPGKLLFALPLEFTTNYKLYILLHLVLAGAAAYRLARHWQASQSAGTLAAISYAFGGSVLFQYCNVIYLVGAAWLPVALLAADRMLVGRSWRWSLGLAVVLALMVLGGDPQSAYHAGLLAVLYAGLLWMQRRRHARSRHARRSQATEPTDPDGSTSVHTVRFGRLRPILLGLAAVSALLLSAVQVLPAWQWTRRSERAVFLYPRSIYEIPQYIARPDHESRREGIAKGLFGVPRRGTHHEHTYHFSVGPWRFAECVWPNFSGSLFPTNRRWTNAIPAESRVWSPSIYLGLLPLLLGLGAFGFRADDVRIRWMSWSLLLAALGSLGWYGVGWLAQEVRYGVSGALPDPDGWGSPVGGLYWLMATGLPGYAYFRFPAKLLVIAQLACSLLAARGLDRLVANRPRRMPWVLAAIAGVSIAGFVATWVVQPNWEQWTRAIPADSLYGPFDGPGALAELRASLVHAALVSAALGLLLRPSILGRRRVAAASLVLFTAVELTVAGRPWILTTADDDFTRQAFYEARIRGLDSDANGTTPHRVYRAARNGWWPKSWPETASPDRYREGLLWERDTLSPRYPLTGSLAMVESTASCLAHDYQTVLRQARQRGPRRPDRVAEPQREILDLLGTRYLVLPEGFAYSETDRVPPKAGPPTPPNAELWRNPQAYPRVWIVHRVARLEPLRRHSPQAVEERTRQVFQPQGAPRDFRTAAVVETDQPLPAELIAPSAEEGPATAPGAAEQPSASCEIVDWQPQRQEILACLPRPGLLVVSESLASGWRAERVAADGTTVRLPILRTNRIFRGVPLPTGEHRVVFSYRPVGFYAAATITAIAWLLVVAGIILRRPNRTPGR